MENAVAKKVVDMEYAVELKHDEPLCFRSNCVERSWKEFVTNFMRTDDGWLEK